MSKNVIHMKKMFFLLVLCLSLFYIPISAKTTYIPTYRNYLHIVNNGDTMAVVNNLSDLELNDVSGLFTLRIEQEDVNHEKVKAIKRAKRAAGWLTFSAVMLGVATAYSNNTIQYMVNRANFELVSDLAAIYTVNSVAEQILEINFWIDNNTDGELFVNDMDRGLVWCILPRQSLKLKLNNPEASRLRISDAKSDFVRYATAVAGSKVTKYTISYEDDDIWIVPFYIDEEVESYGYASVLTKYIRIRKEDYCEEDMSIDDFVAFKKTLKNK